MLPIDPAVINTPGYKEDSERHVLAPRFGLASQEYAMELLEERVKNAGYLDAIGVDMALRAIYQTGYGIFDHAYYQSLSEANKRIGLLKLVSFHDKEDLVNMGRRQNIKRRFAESGVVKYFNLNFTQFLEYPAEECEEMISISRAIAKKDSKHYEPVLAQLTQGER